MIFRLLTLSFLILILFRFNINLSDTVAQTNGNANLQLVAEYQLGFANYQDSFWFNHDGSVVAIHLGEAIEFIDMQALETLGLLQLTLRNAPNEAEIQREMVTSAGFISDDHFVVGISAGNPFRDFGQLLLWNVLEMSELEPLETMASIDNISTSLNGGYLAYTYKVFDVLLENAITGEILYTTQVDGRFGGSPIFSPTQNLLSVVSLDNTIQLIEPEANTINTITPNTIPHDLIFSPSGNLLASHSETAIEIWDINTLESFTTLHFPEGNFITDIDISSDENWIAIAGSQLKPAVNLLIIDFETGEEILATDIYNDVVFTVAFHPSSEILVSGGRDGVVRLWGASSDNPILEFFMDGAVVKLAFSPDGHYLFAQTTSELMIWSVES